MIRVPASTRQISSVNFNQETEKMYEVKFISVHTASGDKAVSGEVYKSSSCTVEFSISCRDQSSLRLMVSNIEQQELSVIFEFPIDWSKGIHFESFLSISKLEDLGIPTHQVFELITVSMRKMRVSAYLRGRVEADMNLLTAMKTDSDFQSFSFTFADLKFKSDCFAMKEDEELIKEANQFQRELYYDISELKQNQSPWSKVRALDNLARNAIFYRKYCKAIERRNSMSSHERVQEFAEYQRAKNG